MPGSNAELFLEYLDNTFGKEDQILSEQAEDGGPKIAMFVYRECPEPGMVTGVTFGLSHRAHPDWKFGRPEMVISMESESLDWPSAALGLTAYFAGKKRFCYGDVFTVDGTLTSETEMDGVLIFAQSLLDPEAATVQLRDYRATLYQYYPIHSAEIPIYEKLGLEGFWNHPEFGMYDPKRKPIKE
ncbi:suppressor of fused domain protein [Roseimicrobium gellanilyticum]|nr:suppressor of fused domain protein [Roseimicrobium gellanilyticum]